MKIKHIDQDVELQFWYPAIYDKKIHIIPVTAMGHIMHEGRLMCEAETKDLISAVPNATTFYLKTARIEQNPLCPKCIEVYKYSPWSPWKKWEDGVKSHGGQPSE